MADLQETVAVVDELDAWVQGIYQLEQEDLVLGGPDGIDNLQAKQLLARSNWLKTQVLGLGAGKQPLDPMLTALAALVTAADQTLYFTGPDAPALTALTAFARTLLAANDAAAARDVLDAASPADVAAAIAALVNSSPATLDTLNELATALGNDANFAATMTAALGLKASWAVIDEVITGAGIVADHGVVTQLRDAIQAMIVVRSRLTGNLTLYVATGGSDSNDGLSAGSPFLTIQKAWDVLHKKYDLNGYTATIQLADGTYSAGLNAYGAITGMTGATSVNFKGNAGNSASVVISVAGATCFNAYHGAKFSVSNLTMTGGSGFYSSGGGAMISGGAGLVFGAMTVNHIGTNVGGNVLMTANYSITGGAYSHFSVASGVISAQGLTITLTGTPAFTAFVSVYAGGILFAATNTFSGSATGSRYSVQVNGAIFVNGAGASYLPGSSAGSAITGGVYA